ncbi:MAG: sigma factor [Pirellulales bacterium]
MSDARSEDHLSRISTIWTMVFQAHNDDREAVKAAQSVVMERYAGTVYRYLLRVLGDSHGADEVFQQFALNFVRGGFRHADPARGRFRDYLKISLLRLVSDYRRSRARGGPRLSLSIAEGAGDDPLTEQEVDRELVASIRDELLSRAWEGLRAIEDQTGRPLHAVLDCRARNPNANSMQMAAELTRRLQPEQPFTDAGIRKTLQRARERFSDLLLHEVVQSLGKFDRDAVEQEMIDLGLHSYCASAFKRRYE